MHAALCSIETLDQIDNGTLTHKYTCNYWIIDLLYKFLLYHPTCRATHTHILYSYKNSYHKKKSLEICTQLEVVYVAFLMDEWCFFLRNLRYFQIFSPPRLFSFLIYSLLSSSSYVKFRGKLINEEFIARDDLSTKSWHHQYAIKSSLKISCKSIHTSIRILLEIVDTKM